MNFARIKRGVLLASIRVDERRRPEEYPAASFVDRQNFVWYHVHLAPKSMIVCDCGGAAKDNPNTGEMEQWAGCTHIVALYYGLVTEDSRKAVLGTIPLIRHQHDEMTSRWLVRLTERGGRMFRPRWVAKALTS